MDEGMAQAEAKAEFDRGGLAKHFASDCNAVFDY